MTETERRGRGRPRWKAEEIDEAIRLVHQEGYTYKDAATKMDLTARTVRLAYRDSGLPNIRRRSTPEHVFQEVQRLIIEDGHTGLSACRKMGIAANTFYTWRRRNNIPGTPSRGRPPSSPISKRLLDVMGDGKARRYEDVYPKIAEAVPPGLALRYNERARLSQNNGPRVRQAPIEALIEFGKREAVRRAFRGFRARKWTDDDGTLWVQIAERKPWER